MDYDVDVAPRRHRLKVTGYNELHDAHFCTVDGCRTVLVDLRTGGTLLRETKPEELIGCEVDVSSAFGFVFIANGARLVLPDAPALEATRPELADAGV